MAAEADLESHINSDATATNRQEHVDDCVGGGDRDGVASQKTLSRRKGVEPIGRLALTTIKYENLLQEVVEAGLERGEPLQGELDKEDGGRQGKATKHKARVDNPLDPNPHMPPAKKIRLEHFSHRYTFCLMICMTFLFSLPQQFCMFKCT